MKKDIEQLINLTKNSSILSTKALGLDIRKYGYLKQPEQAWLEYVQKLMVMDTGLAVGSVIRIEEFLEIFPTKDVLVLIGGPRTGNLIIYIDQACLKLEKQYVVYRPYDIIRSLSIVTHPCPKTNCGVGKVFRQYINVVEQIQKDSRPVDSEETLLSQLFEYVVGDNVQVTTAPLFKT